MQDFAKKEIKKATDYKELEIWEVWDMRVRWIILDGVRDALVPHFCGKNTTHEMLVSLQNLFKNKNEKQVLVLEDKFKSTKMLKGESVTSYLMRFSQIKDELISIDVTILDGNMVSISLKGYQGMETLHQQNHCD